MNPQTTPEYISVRAINQWVKETLDELPFLRNITIRGEVSNFKRYPTAMYFSLKDGEAKLNVVMFLYQQFPAYVPKDGDDVLITGQVTLYVKDGSFQLAAKQIRLFGEGDQLLALKRLKEKLAQEGLFDTSRKRPFRAFPHHLVVISGQDSAALKDITFNMQRRYPLVTLTVIPSKVQGPLAVSSILHALDLAYGLDADGLILARGGGAEEDLFAFNDERLVRKLAIAPFPIVSAIGHEINLSLTDLVADLRASTPTAAVELITPDVRDVLQDMVYARQRTEKQIRYTIERLKYPLERVRSLPVMKSPIASLLLQKDKMTRLKTLVDERMHWFLEKLRMRLNQLKEKNQALSHQSVLNRGYSITFTEDGRPITSIKHINMGQTITTTLKDGIIQSDIKKIKGS
jgi:exodeoxyribonuclease VII large subunit